MGEGDVRCGTLTMAFTGQARISTPQPGSDGPQRPVTVNGTTVTRVSKANRLACAAKLSPNGFFETTGLILTTFAVIQLVQRMSIFRPLSLGEFNCAGRLNYCIDLTEERVQQRSWRADHSAPCFEQGSPSQRDSAN